MTKEDIVSTAFRVWGEELFQKMSLSDVAAALGCTKPALYRYFRNKDELLEAMYASFYDQFAGFLSDCFDMPMGGKHDANTTDAALLRFATELGAFFIRNKGKFLFLLAKVYGSQENERQLSFQLGKRGIDLRHFLTSEEEAVAGEGDKNTRLSPILHPSKAQMVMSAVLFFVSREHFGDEPWRGKAGENAAVDSPGVLCGLEETIARGLGFIRGRVETVDFDKLEKAVSFDVAFDSETDEIHLKLLKAVGEVLAETGPFEASMEMFARKSGLSKSSLYSHFASREDMIVSLFVNEFKRIAATAVYNKAKSDVPEERFYLTMLAIAGYLRAHTMILRAIDKARTRHKDHPKGPLAEKSSLFKITDEIFAGIRVPSMRGELTLGKKDTDYVLFILVNALMFRPDGMDYGDVGNDSMRIVFRFLTLGLQGLTP
jgi:AcrR family transcriptional regulator